jgi:hypothetical protein
LGSITSLEHQFDDPAGDVDLGSPRPTFRPLGAPLERCAELLGVDLTTLRHVAAEVEPYIRVDGTKVYSLMQLEAGCSPTRTAGSAAATSAAAALEPRVPGRPWVEWQRRRW